MYRADELIGRYDAEQEAHGQLYLQGDEGVDSSSDEDRIFQDAQRELEDVEDERDLWKRKEAMMTDDQIARLLAKQEELGLGSDELLLLDGKESMQTTGNLRGESIFGSSCVSGEQKRSHKDSLSVLKQRDPYDGLTSLITIVLAYCSGQTVVPALSPLVYLTRISRKHSTLLGAMTGLRRKLVSSSAKSSGCWVY